MSKRVVFNLSSDDMRRLVEFSRSIGSSKAESVQQLLSIWEYMDMAKSDDLPIYATLDRLHVLNDAALEEAKASARLDQHLKEKRAEELQALRRRRQDSPGKMARELYDALELKPGAFGFAVDLKKVLAMLWKLRSDG